MLLYYRCTMGGEGWFMVMSRILFFNMFLLSEFVQWKLKALQNKFSKLKDLIAFFFCRQWDFFWIFWIANQQTKKQSVKWKLRDFKGINVFFCAALLLKWIFLLSIFLKLFLALLDRLQNEMLCMMELYSHWSGGISSFVADPSHHVLKCFWYIT